MNYFHKYKFSPPNNWYMFIREVLSFASFRSLFHLASAICAETQTQRQADTHVHTHRLPMGIVFTVLWIDLFSMLYLPWYWSVTDRLYNTHTSAYKTTMGPCGLAFARLWIWRETKFELCHNLLQRSNSHVDRMDPLLLHSSPGVILETHPFSCVPLILHLKISN